MVDGTQNGGAFSARARVCLHSRRPRCRRKWPDNSNARLCVHLAIDGAEAAQFVELA